MLKWLRKYNTYILVVGGCLLMVAFLLQGVLNDLTKRGMLGGTAFKVGSKKVTTEEFGLATREYYALTAVLESTGLTRGRDIVGLMGGGETPEHYYLLTREAEQAGFIGGVREGEDYFDEIVDAASGSLTRFGGDAATAKAMVSKAMNAAMDNVEGQARLTRDQIYKAFAKLRAAKRLQDEYAGTLRFGERRLAVESRATMDAVQAEFVLVPAERELAGIPEPDQAAIQAHFEKYKDTPKGGGEYGIGYKLPARVKIAWLELDRSLISGALNVDSIEIEKRFLAKYPTGQVGAGVSADDERKRIEADVRKELTDKAMRDAERVVRNEIERSLRKVERDADFYRLPAEWAASRPDFAKIREVVAARMMEQYKIAIPAPRVTIRDAYWVELTDAAKLEGIGAASLNRGQQQLGFAQILGGLREISESPEFGLQVGVPFSETLENSSKNRYFFVVLDARKESAPDSLEEVRPDVVKNIKRLQAYEKLKARESEIRATAVAQGLTALVTPPAGVTDPVPVRVQDFTASKTRTAAPTEASGLDSQEFRDKVVAATAGLDPLADVAKVDADKKTFSTPVDKSLSLCVYRVKKLMPMTVERFRTAQGFLMNEATKNALGESDESNPFSLTSMEKRLDVKYEQGHERTKTDKKAKPRT